MSNIPKYFALALADEPRCRSTVGQVWYMTVLEAIRDETIQAITTFKGLKLDNLSMIFWSHTTNCIRVGTAPNTYTITLNSDPVFEIIFTVDASLKLITARAYSEALSEAIPEIIDVTKYVDVFYQEFLIHLVSKLEKISVPI